MLTSLGRAIGGMVLSEAAARSRLEVVSHQQRFVLGSDHGAYKLVACTDGYLKLEQFLIAICEVKLDAFYHAGDCNYNQRRLCKSTSGKTRWDMGIILAVWDVCLRAARCSGSHEHCRTQTTSFY